MKKIAIILTLLTVSMTFTFGQTVIDSISISQNYNKKAKQAVDTYNGGLLTTSFWDQSELGLSMSGNGIGITLRF
jgi:hypothetical protein